MAWYEVTEACQSSVYTDVVMFVRFSKADEGLNYEWAKRHTWQSWRNRYKKNQTEFDERINDHLRIYPPHPDGKGEYVYRRIPNASQTRGERSRRVQEDDVDEEEIVDLRTEEEEEFPDDPSGIAGGDNRRSLRQPDHEHLETTHGDDDGGIETPERPRRASARSAQKRGGAPARSSQSRPIQNEDQFNFE